VEDDDERVFADLQRAAAANLQTGRRRGKVRKDTFVKVPLWWIELATRATRTPQAFVCIWLLHLSWRARSTTFPLPNGRLGKRGSDRRAKMRALAALEAAGLITVKRRHGKTPIVTLVVL
jgi:CRP-like cAMP-binding protein